MARIWSLGNRWLLLRLPLRHDHLQPIEIRRDMDLAAETAVLARLPGSLQCGFLQFLARLKPGDPGRVDVHVAGRTSTGPVALRYHALPTVFARDFHHRDTQRRIYLAPTAVRLGEYDPRH